MATQNPIEMEGTYPLPEAEVDRFLFKLNVGFPDRLQLAEIFRRTTGDHQPTVERVAEHTIAALREIVVAAGKANGPVPPARRDGDVVHPSRRASAVN